MKKNPDYLSAIIIFVWVIVLAVLCAQGLRGVGAQDENPVVTIFEQGCLEGLSENSYRIHFYYTSTGSETFTFHMGEVTPTTSETLPYAGHAFTNVPPAFTTLEGVHDDFYLEAQGDTDSQYTFTLIFTTADGVDVPLPVNTWDYPVWCEPGQYTHPAPTPDAGNGFLAINNPMPMSTPAPMYQVRTCVIQYPKVILVCHE